jgi:hypothetical protein
MYDFTLKDVPNFAACKKASDRELSTWMERIEFPEWKSEEKNWPVKSGDDIWNALVGMRKWIQKQQPSRDQPKIDLRLGRCRFTGPFPILKPNDKYSLEFCDVSNIYTSPHVLMHSYPV